MEKFLILVPLAALIGLFFALVLWFRVKRAEAGTGKMIEIADAIHEGAMTFLRREYSYLIIFVIVLAAVLAIFIDPLTAVCFVVGALLSATAGFVGMNVSTRANVRTAHAARSGVGSALTIAFSSGTIMGMMVAGLGLLGLGILYLWIRDPAIVNGYALGASSIALFARVGGGSTPRQPMSGPTWWARLRQAFPKTTPAMPE